MPGLDLPVVEARVVRTLDLARPLPAGARFLAAASGLEIVGDRFVVVADDAHHLALFEREGAAPGKALRILDGDLPDDHAERKRRKPDFEAVALLPPCPGLGHGGLLLVGSGSTADRERGVVVEIEPGGGLGDATRVLDLGLLFAPLRDRVGEINVEGAFVLGGDLVLLSRGNRSMADNHVAHYPLTAIETWLGGGNSPVAPGSTTPLWIGAIDGVPLGVTDGAPLPDGRWVFSAAAEDTRDSYNDGALAGAAVGVVDARGQVGFVGRLAPDAKVEGIVATVHRGRTTLAMVTDADDPARPSVLLAVEIPDS